MARIVKPEEYASKRNQIVDVALRHMVTRGYNKLVIQDILDEIQISSGAFHHYFDSRDTLLEALIQRVLEESEKLFTPLIHDPHLSAIQKLQGFFGTLDSLRAAHRTDVAKLSRVWYADDNSVVRMKMDEAVVERRAPLLNEIVRQGVQEGVFTILYPDQAGEVILTLMQGMGSTHIKLLSRAMQESDSQCIDEIVQAILTVHAAYMDAIERVLGAPPLCLYRADEEVARMWVSALQENG